MVSEDTVANLKEIWRGEDHEVESMYPAFEKEAEEENEKMPVLGHPRKFYEPANMDV